MGVQHTQPSVSATVPACVERELPRGTVEAYLRSAVLTALSSPVPAGTRLKSSLMRATVLVATLAIAVVALTFAPSGNAFAAQSIEQCNGDDNSGGLGLTCSVEVVNTLNVDTGAESSVVTTTECHGAANTKPTDCTGPTVTEYNTLTTSVNQCNDSANGAGASLICTVTVTNKVVGDDSKVSAKDAATVNQCVGSGAEGSAPTLNCDPAPANTIDATVTQCNGSANGGGAANRVECTVPDSFISAQFPLQINQCNGSANGGGSVVTCSASVISPAGMTVTPLVDTSAPVKNVLHDSKTDGFGMTGTNGAEGVFLGAGVLMLLAGGLLTAAFATRKAGARR